MTFTFDSSCAAGAQLNSTSEQIGRATRFTIIGRMDINQSGRDSREGTSSSRCRRLKPWKSCHSTAMATRRPARTLLINNRSDFFVLVVVSFASSFLLLAARQAGQRSCFEWPRSREWRCARSASSRQAMTTSKFIARDGFMSILDPPLLPSGKNGPLRVTFASRMNSGQSEWAAEQNCKRKHSGQTQPLVNLLACAQKWPLCWFIQSRRLIARRLGRAPQPTRVTRHISSSDPRKSHLSNMIDTFHFGSPYSLELS